MSAKENRYHRRSVKRDHPYSRRFALSSVENTMCHDKNINNPKFSSEKFHFVPSSQTSAGSEGLRCLLSSPLNEAPLLPSPSTQFNSNREGKETAAVEFEDKWMSSSSPLVDMETIYSNEKEELDTSDEDQEYEVITPRPSSLSTRCTQIVTPPSGAVKRKYALDTSEYPLWNLEEVLVGCQIPTLAKLYTLGHIRHEAEAHQEIIELSVWKSCIEKEIIYTPDPYYFDRHSDLTYRMRYILMNWLMEVSMEFMMHREVVYLSMNLIDRYLSLKSNVQRRQLQLIGISSLFIAAKIEEIYPPKLKYFSNVCDGACTGLEIVQTELDIMRTLKWNLLCPTANFWLNFYLQNAAKWYPKDFASSQPGFTFSRTYTAMMSQLTRNVPHGRYEPGARYRTSKYLAAISLIDIAIHDLECLTYSQSIIAATAFFLKCCQSIPNAATVLKVCTGYCADQIEACCEWMSLFLNVPLEVEIHGHFYSKIHQSDQHNIQVHNRAIVPHLNQIFDVENGTSCK